MLYKIISVYCILCLLVESNTSALATLRRVEKLTVSEGNVPITTSEPLTTSERNELAATSEWDKPLMAPVRDKPAATSTGKEPVVPAWVLYMKSYELPTGSQPQETKSGFWFTDDRHNFRAYLQTVFKRVQLDLYHKSRIKRDLQSIVANDGIKFGPGWQQLVNALCELYRKLNKTSDFCFERE